MLLQAKIDNRMITGKGNGGEQRTFKAVEKQGSIRYVLSGFGMEGNNVLYGLVGGSNK